MSNVDLKPCPFCGGAARIADGPIPAIVCGACLARTGEWSGDDYAANAWNQRAAAPVPLQCPKCGGKRLKLMETFQGRRPVECMNCDWEWDWPEAH